MTDYLPTTNEVRGSLVFLNKHYAEQRADVDVDLLVVESETAAQFDRMIAEVRRQAAEEALLKAEDAVSELIDGYESTADEMRGRSEWVDSNRYSNYAAGLSVAAGSIRKLAAEYKKAEG